MDNSRRVFGSICNGEIDIILFEEKYWEGSKIVLKSFFENECVCQGTEISSSDQAIDDLTLLCKEVAADGVSIIAVEKSSDRVVGVSFNKIQKLGGLDETPFFIEFMENKCKSVNSKALMQLMVDIDSMIDLYEFYQTDCLFEIMFLGTLVPEFGKKSIGKYLAEASVQLAKELRNSNVVGSSSPVSVQPAAATAIFTSKYSQRIGETLGFVGHKTVWHKDYTFNGKIYTDRITNKSQDTMVLCSLKL